MGRGARAGLAGAGAGTARARSLTTRGASADGALAAGALPLRPLRARLRRGRADGEALLDLTGADRLHRGGRDLGGGPLGTDRARGVRRQRVQGVLEGQRRAVGVGERVAGRHAREIAAHRVGVLVAVLGLGGDQAADHGGELRGDAAQQLGELVGAEGAVVQLDRPVQRDQSDHARGVEVVGGGRLRHREQLRRHVAGGAVDHADMREAHVGLVDGDPEVGQARDGELPPARLEHDVRGLHVAVDPALGVHMGEAVQQLVEDHHDGGLGELAAGLDHRLERPAGDQRHRDHDVLVLSTPAVGGQQVRMVEADALLAHEAHEVGGIALAQDLRGAQLLGLRVPGAPHGPGPALGDQVDEREAPDNNVSHDFPSITSALRPRLC